MVFPVRRRIHWGWDGSASALWQASAWYGKICDSIIEAKPRPSANQIPGLTMEIALTKSQREQHTGMARLFGVSLDRWVSRVLSSVVMLECSISYDVAMRGRRVVGD